MSERLSPLGEENVTDGGTKIWLLDSVCVALAQFAQ